jgi:hypothetical protein
MSKKITRRQARFRLSSAELSTIAFVSTLIIAGIAIHMRIDSPAVWTFLGTAIATAASRMGSRPANQDEDLDTRA